MPLRKSFQWWTCCLILSVVFVTIGSTSEMCELCSCTEANRHETPPCQSVICYNKTPLLLRDSALPTCTKSVHVIFDNMSINTDNIVSFIRSVSEKKLIELSVVRNNELESLTHINSAALPSLVTLNFTTNKIKSFSGSFFAHMPSLRNLDLSNNLLEGSLSLSPEMSNITKLDLSRNVIVQFKAPGSSLVDLNLSFNCINSTRDLGLSGMTSLRELNLKNNLIEHIDNDMFKENVNLKFLYLSHNNIKTLHLTFPFPPSLLLLDVSFCQINEVQFDPSLVSLAVINMSFNQIKNLHSLCNLPVLGNLNAAGNSLKDLNGLKNCSWLQDLDASHNLITSMPDDFPPKLHTLNISSNQINELKSKSDQITKGTLITLDISNQPHLKSIPAMSFCGMFIEDNDVCPKLYLRNSSVQHIDKAAFKCTKFCKVFLSHNKIEELPEDAFMWENVTVDIQNNPIRCDCSNSWILNKYLPPLYKRNQTHLGNLRCGSPKSRAGRRLVHWLSKSSMNGLNSSFCANALKEDPSNNRILLTTSPLMITVLTVLGLTALFLVIGALVYQFKILQKHRRSKNRRL